MNILSTSNTIKSLRESNGMTQKEFAQHCDISKSVLSQYETGIRNPSNKVLYKICRLFEVSPSYFGLQTIGKKTETHITKDTLKEGKPLDNRLQNHLLDEIESLKEMNTNLMAQVRAYESSQGSVEAFARELDASSTFKEIAENLNIKSRQWDYVFDNMLHPLAVLRGDNIIRSVNNEFLRQFGYEKLEMVFKSLADFIHPDDSDTCHISNGSSGDSTCRILKKNGKYCEVLCKSQSFGNEDNKFNLVLIECIEKDCPDCTA